MKRSCYKRLIGAVSLVTWISTTFAAFPNLGDLGEKFKKAEGTATKVGKVVKGATGLSLEEEMAVGDAVSVEIVSLYGGIWRDEAATRRINVIGRGLARYADRQDLIWSFGLLNSDAVNAFSAPGGRVFITRGLYQRLDSDDKLAGALAHEIEHIDERHALKIIARGEFLSGVTGLVSERSKDFAQFDQAISLVTQQILEKGFDPNTEYEADKEGRDLATTTGYAPGGLRAVLARLRADTGGSAKTVFSTHPPLDERLKRLPNDPEPSGP
ncbi:MAG TPA: M48 family metalloprotease [Opitutaceae bacterium]|nr:M48 family metalloprotease [Opitutaceae bacterium]